MQGDARGADVARARCAMTQQGRASGARALGARSRQSRRGRDVPPGRRYHRTPGAGRQVTRGAGTRKGRRRRNAETRLHSIRQRGPRGLPVQEASRLLSPRALSLRADGTRSRHQGARPPGSTVATVEGRSLAQSETLINARRAARYRGTPVRRTSVSNKNGTRRPCGRPPWSETRLQAGMRAMLAADDAPQVRDRAHRCRPHRGRHPARRDGRPHGQATQGCIEGDLRACFDRIAPAILAGLVPERCHDTRCLRRRRG